MALFTSNHIINTQTLKSHIALSQITMLANVLPSVYICHQIP